MVGFGNLRGTSSHSNTGGGGSRKAWLISTGFDPFAVMDTLDRADLCVSFILFIDCNSYDTNESAELQEIPEICAFCFRSGTSQPVAEQEP